MERWDIDLSPGTMMLPWMEAAGWMVVELTENSGNGVKLDNPVAKLFGDGEKVG